MERGREKQQERQRQREKEETWREREREVLGFIINDTHTDRERQVEKVRRTENETSQ